MAKNKSIKVVENRSSRISKETIDDIEIGGLACQRKKKKKNS